jgi:hypothetical protein
MRNTNILKIALLTVFLTLPAFSGATAQEPEAMTPESSAAQEMAPEAQEAAPEAREAAQEKESAAQMTINRFLICQDVKDHEPVGVTTTFPAGTEQAYAFLEATDISADVRVEFVWYHNDNETARVPLSIRKGYRWRTNSSKKLAGRGGKWKVEIQDQTGAVLASRDFTVE